MSRAQGTGGNSRRPRAGRVSAPKIGADEATLMRMLAWVNANGMRASAISVGKISIAFDATAPRNVAFGDDEDARETLYEQFGGDLWDRYNKAQDADESVDEEELP